MGTAPGSHVATSEALGPHVATSEALGPVGAVEQALAERVAALLWRLARAQKFEAGLIQNAQEAVEDDIHRHRQLFGDGLPGSQHPAELRDRAEAAASTDRALARVLDQPGSAPGQGRRCPRDRAARL